MIHGNYDKDWRLEIKICHFWEFHKSRWINKRQIEGHENKKKYCGRGNSDYPNHRSWNKMVKERKKNEGVAVKRRVWVRRNCNVFNLAMENVLKGLPDKIRNQLSRHHTMFRFIHICISNQMKCQMYTILNHFQIARSWRWSIRR